MKFTVIPAVHLFLINEEGKFLLARRFNTGYEDGNFSVIAGHVEEGETNVSAMCREAKEEANIHIEKDDIEFAHVMYRKRERAQDSDRIDFFFVCKKWTGTLEIMEPNKCDQLAWVDVLNIPNNTIGYVRAAIERFISKHKYSEYGW